MDQLEYTVMELGAEMFRLKQEISQMTQVKDNLTKAFRKLQDVLDEKGIIDNEEFDIALNMQDIFNPLADGLDDEEDDTPGKHELH
jgi:regulator of replication initiation timing